MPVGNHNFKFLLTAMLWLVGLALPGCDEDRNGDVIEFGDGDELRSGDCHDGNGNVEQCADDEQCLAGRCVDRDNGCVNNTQCADEEVCDPDTNLCVVLECDDEDACTEDDFGAPHECSNDRIAGCCNDANPCAQGVCDPAVDRCVECLDDADCPDNRFCAAGQCMRVGDCEDGDLCTQDRPRNHQCANDPIAGCCVRNDDCAPNQTCDMNDNICIGLNCDDGDVCTTDGPGGAPHTCNNTPIVGCCNDDNDCGDGVCNPQSNRCVECLDDADCPDDEQCNEVAQLCQDLACDDRNVCTLDRAINNECSNEPIAGCCNNDAACGDGVCNPQSNRCVECLDDADCGPEDICNPQTNACVAVICLPLDACDAPVVDDQECVRQDVRNCCLNSDDDASCRRLCANNGDCTNGEVCRVNGREAFCVPANLPVGYTMGCPTSAVDGRANVCTTCSNRDAAEGSTLCSLYERCGNLWDDDGDGRVDEGARTPAGQAPNPAMHCVGCIGNADCAVGQICDLLTRECSIPPSPEVCNGLDDNRNGVIDDGAPCAAGFSCQNGACQPVPVAEACNGVDDDRDGVIDDGAPCPAGQSCRNGACQVDPVPEVCNGLDDNRNGVIDDGAPCAAGFSCQNGACQPVPVAEACNGVDDDRDGVIDDGAPCPAGQSCRNGACQVDPVPEVCNGLDDNRNGVIDDGAPCAAGFSCQNGACQPIPNNQSHVLQWLTGDERATADWDMYALCVLPPLVVPYHDWGVVMVPPGQLERRAGVVQYSMPLPQAVGDPWCITNLRNRVTGEWAAGCRTGGCPNSDALGRFQDSVRGGAFRPYTVDSNGLAADRRGLNFYSPGVPAAQRP